MTITSTVTERASEFLGRRSERRSFLRKTAMVGTAVAAAGTDFILRPGSAYAACTCLGRSCDCSSLCCDGYTEFCCQIYGDNSCPPDTVLAGWWKVDNSSYCSGAARYYMDCNKYTPACSCGSSGVCRGSDTTCQCRSCGYRKDGCTVFRYGNCNNHISCVGPIMCRVVTCTKPWEIDPGCSTVSRTDNNTRYHHRACLEEPPPEPTDTELAFVEALYRDFLGRPSDASGKEYWGSVLARRRNYPIGGRDTVAYSFAFSQEYASTVVRSLYQMALSRNPDTSGGRYWRDQLVSRRLRPRDLATELLASDEFFTKAGRTNSGFVDRLYGRVLDRKPSSSERRSWVGQLAAGASRRTVAYAVFQSVESRRRRVAAIYRRFLGRNPDTSGRDYWVDVIDAREDISVALYITSGSEYLTRADRRFG